MIYHDSFGIFDPSQGEPIPDRINMEPMEHTTISSTENLIDISNKDSSLCAEVKRRSGVNINRCWHCQSCAAGCPFVSAMDYPPNRIIRLVQLGLKKEALESSGIWICVGCNTCSIQCPNAIDIPAVNDTLREIAIEEGVTIAEPDAAIQNAAPRLVFRRCRGFKNVRQAQARIAALTQPRHENHQKTFRTKTDRIGQ